MRNIINNSCIAIDLLYKSDRRNNICIKQLYRHEQLYKLDRVINLHKL